MNFSKLLIFSIVLFSFSSCKEDCMTTDWTGNYIGKDFVSKTSNGSTPVAEPPVDVNVEITSNTNNQPMGANLKIKATFLYSSSSPLTIELFGVATCEKTFTFYDKGFFDPTQIDANGNKFITEYTGGLGSFINESEDVQIVINEKKTFDNTNLSSQNYTATHTLKLNKQ